MAPKMGKIANAYAKDVNEVKTGLLDDSLRSYVDSGEDFFENETFDGKKRSEIVERVRANILKRMQQENKASLDSAGVQFDKNLEYNDRIMGKINEIKRLRRDYIKNAALYSVMLGKNVSNDNEKQSYVDNIQLLIDNTGGQGIIGNQAGIVQGNNDLQNVGAQEDEGAAVRDANPVNPVNPQFQPDNGPNPVGNVDIVQNVAINDNNEPAQAVRTEREEDIAYLRSLKTELEQAGQRGAIKRFFGSLANSMSSVKSDNEKRIVQISKTVDEAQALSEEWNRKREEYAEKIYKKHDEKYDSLAKSWYELTQSLSGSKERTIPKDSQKSILEYTGMYDRNELDKILWEVESNPYREVRELPVTESKKEGKNPFIFFSTHIRKHTKIAMYSLPGENGIKTRYKLGSDLIARRSKKQFTPDSPTALKKVADNDGPIITETDDILESDELDIKGRKLYSESSAEILQAKLSDTGKVVHGFYINGEYFSDEETKEGEKIIGKSDLSYWGRRDFVKQGKAERLRAAIRKSAFFQHVNAATIQYYTSYGADEEYGLESIRKTKDAKWKEWWNEWWENNGMGEGGIWGSALAKSMFFDELAGSRTIDTLPPELKGAAVCEYVKYKLTENPAPGKPFPVENPASDPLIAYLRDRRPFLRSVMIQMLADDENPVLWTVSRNMALKIDGLVDPRTRSMMERHHESGMMMRLGLLDEIMNHQGALSEFDSDNLLGFIKIPGLSVKQQELENQRGVGAWLMRNTLNGNLIKEVLGDVSLGIDLGNMASDITHKARDDDWKLDSATKERRSERQCWFLYGQTMASGSMLGGMLGGAAVLVGGAVGAKRGGVMNGAAKGRDGYFQAADAIGMISDIKFLVTDAIYPGLKWVGKRVGSLFSDKLKEKLKEEKAAKSKELDDKDFGMLKLILQCLTSMLNLADSIRDIASYHVATDSDKGKWKTWGNLMQWKGPLQWIFDTSRNMISMVNDCFTIIANARRIYKISKVDEELETAINTYVEEAAKVDITRMLEQSLREDDQETPALEGIDLEEDSRNMNEIITKRAALGKAASENSQTQYYLALTKAKAEKNINTSAWNMVSTTFKIGRDTTKQFAATGEIASMAATAALMIAPKVTDFLGWVVGKTAFDYRNFRNNIAAMLGSKDYVHSPYFDTVLKRETGIVSSAYLVDLARIFMSIDTHALLQKENIKEFPGELELAKKVVGTLYGNVTDENIKTVSLGSLLKYSGFNSGSDWRAVLRHSITG